MDPAVEAVFTQSRVLSWQESRLIAAIRSEQVDPSVEALFTQSGALTWHECRVIVEIRRLHEGHEGAEGGGGHEGHAGDAAKGNHDPSDHDKGEGGHKGHAGNKEEGSLADHEGDERLKAATKALKVRMQARGSLITAVMRDQQHQL